MLRCCMQQQAGVCCASGGAVPAAVLGPLTLGGSAACVDSCWGCGVVQHTPAGQQNRREVRRIHSSGFCNIIGSAARLHLANSCRP